MIRKVISLLLIGFLALPGATFPHSHAGSGVPEPAEHDVRPHVHLGHDHHHSSAATTHRHHDDDHDLGQASHHDEQPGYPSDESPVGDHDSDAVYVSAVVAALPDGSQTQDSPAKFSSLLWPVEPRLASCGTWPHTWAPPRYGERVPDFLRTTKLLI